MSHFWPQFAIEKTPGLFQWYCQRRLEDRPLNSKSKPAAPGTTLTLTTLPVHLTWLCDCGVFYERVSTGHSFGGAGWCSYRAAGLGVKMILNSWIQVVIKLPRVLDREGKQQYILETLLLVRNSTLYHCFHLLQLFRGINISSMTLHSSPPSFTFAKCYF